MNGTLQIKSMNLSYDGSKVWIKGRAQIPAPDRKGTVSGSDFFEFDMTCCGLVDELDENIEIGDRIEIQKDTVTGYWNPIATPNNQRLSIGSKCKPNCPDCKAVRWH